jgi:UPF0755 protein
MVNKALVRRGAVLASGIIILSIAINQINRFWLTTSAKDAAVYEVEIRPGGVLSNIAPVLAEKELVNQFWFRVYTKIFGGSSRIDVGTYSITKGMSYAAIIAVMHDGKAAEVKLIIPEGFTIKQIGERVIAVFPNITAEDWARATGQFSPEETMLFIVSSGKPDGVDLEGYLFPDTYNFVLGVSADDIVTRMIDEMAEKVATVGLRQQVGEGKPFASLHEALTLASILEKEVRTPTTMAKVADIFLKRLAIGMALQADSTVNYVTGGDSPSVSLADLATDSLYNTYMYPGLPPGPISNPGLNALAAVASPSVNDYYYFLTDDAGNVYYAEMHDEHVANKAKYLK